MNFYVVVEGKGEKIIYRKWIKYINPTLRIVDSIDKVTNNNVYIISGNGYPSYFDIISNAIEDVSTLNCFDLLVVSVDSEKMTYMEKYHEIKTFIDQKNKNINYKIIIQHFCIETWALGNKIIIPRNPQSKIIRNYIQFYDVLLNDPENLPPYKNLNRAQFAYSYLHAILNDRYRNLTYHKTTPEVITNHKFFNRIKSRYLESNHISSFKGLLDAFK